MGKRMSRKREEDPGSSELLTVAAPLLLLGRKVEQHQPRREGRAPSDTSSCLAGVGGVTEPFSLC